MNVIRSFRLYLSSTEGWGEVSAVVLVTLAPAILLLEVQDFIVGGIELFISSSSSPLSCQWCVPFK